MKNLNRRERISQKGRSSLDLNRATKSKALRNTNRFNIYTPKYIDEINMRPASLKASRYIGREISEDIPELRPLAWL